MSVRGVSLAIGTAALLSLPACGYSTGERALSGAGIGALGGLGVAGMTHGDPLTGAIVGGGLGAAVGAITTPDRDRDRRYRGRDYYGRDYDRRHYYDRRGRYYR